MLGNDTIMIILDLKTETWWSLQISKRKYGRKPEGFSGGEQCLFFLIFEKLLFYGKISKNSLANILKS